MNNAARLEAAKEDLDLAKEHEEIAVSDTRVGCLFLAYLGGGQYKAFTATRVIAEGAFEPVRDAIAPLYTE